MRTFIFIPHHGTDYSIQLQMIKPLTSLRFFFALMVFSSHLLFIKAPAFVKAYQQIFQEGGRLGVGFFFILSGFILSLNYKKRFRERTIEKAEFWLTRFARLYPLHILTLLISIPVSLSDLSGGFITGATKLVCNLFLVQGFIPSEKWYFTFNNPSWSISDEQFFYLLFPFAVIFINKYPRLIKYSLPLLLLIPAGIYFCPEALQQKYFYVFPLTRFADFYLGILLYELFESNKFAKLFHSTAAATCVELSAILLFIIFFAAHPFVQDAYRFSFYYWLPMTALIFCLAWKNGFVSTLLSSRILVYLGEISFGFYMIHELAIRYAVQINNRLKWIQNDYLLAAIIFLAALLASHFSFKLIELPARDFIKKRYYFFRSNQSGRK